MEIINTIEPYEYRCIQRHADSKGLTKDNRLPWAFLPVCVLPDLEQLEHVDKRCDPWLGRAFSYKKNVT